ncbi:MAG TPA: glycine cleavage system aminomethyltransferase GcvT [Rubricoccaceae bacterium]|nr:glycine cleavage system aminomethyltransferase GcvT [Rubricoccaceae bacterium]
MDTALQTTPLTAVHRALGAKMMPFGGFDMPVQYSGILDEHRAVREAAGLFDVSHMGEFVVRGPEALAFVQGLVTNDASKLFAPVAGSPGRAMYTVMCHAHGGAVDDLLVYRLGEDEFLLVVNAANIEKDLAHVLAEHRRRGPDCTVENISDNVALLALQGPKAFDVLEQVTDLPVRSVPYYHFLRPEPGAFLGCQRALLSHTGYTGEQGMEIYCEPEKAAEVWTALTEAGAALGLKPAGLGARDTLRLEAGFALYGHELTDDVNPLEAGLGWVVKLDKGEFTGSEALRQVKEAGPRRKLVGFVVEDRGVPRQGYALTDADGQPIGEVTSGTQSPTLGQGVGLGFVPNDAAFTTPGSALGVDVRGRVLKAAVRKPPFHKPAA